MTDSVRIVITRDCKPDGSGGTIVDDAAVVLPDTVLDTLCAAFSAAYGVHAVASDDPEADPVPVTLERNVSYRIRMFATEVLQGYGAKTAADEAMRQATATAEAIKGGVVLVDSTPKQIQ